MNSKTTARRIRQECVVANCSAVDDGPHGYCKKHMTRIRRHGSPDVVKPSGTLGGADHPGWVGDAVTYSGAHMRVRAVRGKASTHVCACGAPAKQWAYDHTDPHELRSTDGPYSADPARYVARCVSCHKRADLALLGYKVRS